MEEKPPIPVATFTDMLIDLSANEAIYSRIYDTDTNALRIVAIRNARVLEKYKVTKEDFVNTYRYYDHHKEDLQKIYKTAVDSAEARKTRLQKK